MINIRRHLDGGCSHIMRVAARELTRTRAHATLSLGSLPSQGGALMTDVALPITAVLPDILAALKNYRRVVIAAPTGSGKTTLVPQAILDSYSARDKGVIVVQPRRVACRSAARFIADARGVPLGGEVGYRVRFDDRTSSTTRLCFCTDGVLLRMLERAPHLPNIATVIFDEFHERRTSMDIALGVLQEAQRRHPMLMLVVMSATVDHERIAEYLACPIVTAAGRQYPVTVKHRGGQPTARELPDVVARTTAQLHRTASRGDILAFLPGKAEIDAVAHLLRERHAVTDAIILPFHGELPTSAQDRIFARAEQRKIVLATNVAETSITIPGITMVVDGGYERSARYDIELGADTLVTNRIPRASAEQRAGRAGRTGPGMCIRCWPEHMQLPERSPPEIQRSDLGGALLTLRAMGVRDISAFPFPDPPHRERIAAAEDLLTTLGALDAEGALTPIGWRMLDIPLSPRYARMVVEAERRDRHAVVALVAALLQCQPVFAPCSGGHMHPAQTFATDDASDCFTLLHAFSTAREHTFAPAWCEANGLLGSALVEAAQLYQRIVRTKQRTRSSRRGQSPARDVIRQCITAGLLDRVALRNTDGTYTLANGAIGTLDHASVVRDAQLIVAGSVRALRTPSLTGATVRIGDITAIDRVWLAQLAPKHHITERTIVERFPHTQTARIRTTERYRSIIFAEHESIIHMRDAQDASVRATKRLAPVVAALRKLG